MKVVFSSIAFGMLLMLQSCSKDVLEGDGSVKTETRAVSTFSFVEIAGARNAEIIYAPVTKVEVTGYENLVGVYQSKVNDGKLSFSFPNNLRVKDDNISLKIYTPATSGIHLSGNTNVTIGDGFVLNELETTISGNGNIYFGTGTITNLKFKVSGNSEIFAKKLLVQNADIQFSGNGFTELQVEKQLNIKIIGNAEVHYWGNPTLSTSISGNGKTIKH